jgi:actin-related protein 8
MAMLLRKVWGSVSNRSDSADRDRNSASSSLLTSLGAFDELPSDILMQILRKLGAKDAIKMSVVCKSWKLLVSDNQLWIFYLQHQRDESWDSIFFAETSLRSVILFSKLPYFWLLRNST